MADGLVYRALSSNFLGPTLSRESTVSYPVAPRGIVSFTAERPMGEMQKLVNVKDKPHVIVDLRDIHILPRVLRSCLYRDLPPMYRRLFSEEVLRVT